MCLGSKNLQTQGVWRHRVESTLPGGTIFSMAVSLTSRVFFPNDSLRMQSFTSQPPGWRFVTSVRLEDPNLNQKINQTFTVFPIFRAKKLKKNCLGFPTPTFWTQHIYLGISLQKSPSAPCFLGVSLRLGANGSLVAPQKWYQKMVIESAKQHFQRIIPAFFVVSIYGFFHPQESQTRTPANYHGADTYVMGYTYVLVPWNIPQQKHKLSKSEVPERSVPSMGRTWYFWYLPKKQVYRYLVFPHMVCYWYWYIYWSTSGNGWIFMVNVGMNNKAFRPRDGVGCFTHTFKAAPSSRSAIQKPEIFSNITGWWFFTNPSEKYAPQNGNLPQMGIKIKYLKPPPRLRIIYLLSTPPHLWTRKTHGNMKI